MVQSMEFGIIIQNSLRLRWWCFFLFSDLGKQYKTHSHHQQEMIHLNQTPTTIWINSPFLNLLKCNKNQPNRKIHESCFWVILIQQLYKQKKGTTKKPPWKKFSSPPYPASHRVRRNARGWPCCSRCFDPTRKSMKILKFNQNLCFGWWFQTFFFSTPVQIDSYFSDGLKPPTREPLGFVFFWRDIFSKLSYHGVNPRSDKTHQFGRAFAWGPFPGKHRNCKSKTPKHRKNPEGMDAWRMHLHEKIVDVDVLSWLVIFLVGSSFFCLNGDFLEDSKNWIQCFFGWNTVSVHMPNWGFGGFICGTMTIDVRWFLLSQGTPPLE